ncbi:hypothetical protein A3C26_02140 [Candidatus Daviesbacteria bacterium RIFCSPHIGHO2_02_FULL_39_12]|uniref:Addiction module toxin RelE n=1 Tax=Candidatus Daviesbacteria bacterium RIFCSPHIGHO2_02_FULL_39_12 TaxID=1797770 RepID=A0A1F5J8Z9_9BACT|nr:MAG: hypothetical protein A3C26_02140 [Candidatus Daviesbacteria bacterium RIFCSPHIGHO2_02_FULL_39_12]
MDEGWKIEYYKTTGKKSPVEEFIFSLDVKAQNKIVDMLTLLKEFGITLSLPHVKKVTGTSLWELRILGSNNFRFFYIVQTGKIFLLLHGFQKKKQKTDQRKIDIALKRLAEYQLRSGN